MRLPALIACGACALLVSLPAAAQDKGKEKSTSPAAGAGGTAGAGSTSAARGSVPVQQGQTREQRFQELDKNRDGSISRGEAQASPPLLAIFIETDTNSDGTINITEWQVVPLTDPGGAPVK